MTRAEFIDRLKEGLVGLSTTTANDIIADYQTHFDDGIAAGSVHVIVARCAALVRQGQGADLRLACRIRIAPPAHAQ